MHYIAEFPIISGVQTGYTTDQWPILSGQTPDMMSPSSTCVGEGPEPSEPWWGGLVGNVAWKPIGKWENRRKTMGK